MPAVPPLIQQGTVVRHRGGITLLFVLLTAIMT